MKLSGNKRKGRHTYRYAADEPVNDLEVYGGIYSEGMPKTIKKKKKKVWIILGIVLAVIIAAVAYVYFFYRKSSENAPPRRRDARSHDYINPNNTTNPALPWLSPGDAEKDDNVFTRVEEEKYTFLLMSLDDNVNTDVIMTATLDATNHTMEIVSIPRDTLTNVAWNGNKKANAIYANMRQKYGWEAGALDEGMEGVVEAFADILGYKVDYWFLVDLQAFVALVDAIGGVDFDVPQSMNYDDNDAGLHIHFSAGMQSLTGQQALEVMRFRKGYSNADIGRIDTQQKFLTTAAQQILEKRSSINMIEMANIFLRYIKTNIKLDNLIWFGTEFLKLNADSIKFHTAPGNFGDYVGNDSYVTLYVDQWLELVNNSISPYKEPFTTDDISILTRDANGYLYVTDGNRQGNSSWGSGRGQGYAGAAPQNNGSGGSNTNSSPQSSSAADSQNNSSSLRTGNPVAIATGEPADNPPNPSNPSNPPEEPEGDNLPDGEPGELDEGMTDDHGEPPDGHLETDPDGEAAPGDTEAPVPDGESPPDEPVEPPDSSFEEELPE